MLPYGFCATVGIVPTEGKHTMATDKKHIAVYLDKAVEDALIDFCTTNGLEGKKGPMYSAAVNKALAQYFQLDNLTPDTVPSNTPVNISGNTPHHILGNTPDNTFEQRLAEIEQRLIAQMAEMKAEMKAEILGECVA
jgi:hypothetical protein